jgi:RNA polymerase sigma-70 factor (ECF subfamily)
MDQELAIRAREGDHDAFNQLVAGTIGRLTAVARLILRDEDRAQDAVQDAYLDAWRDIRALRDPARLHAWLHRLLIHACYSQARRVRRRSVIEIDLAPAISASSGSGLRDLELHDQLERGLQRLTTEQRAVLVLVYYLDLPLAETAGILGVPLGTVKSRLHRATEAMRAALEADARSPIQAKERLA